MAERKIELVPLGKLKPYARNARLHSEEQIGQIANSILEFGWTNPILVDSEKGIIAGHGRLKAAEKLKLKEVPVIFLDELTEVQKKAYIIADNKIAENATWDEELLGGEIQELAGEAFDLESLGFSDEELSKMLPNFDEQGDDEDKPKSKSPLEKGKTGTTHLQHTCPSCGYSFSTTAKKVSAPKKLKKKIQIATKVVKPKTILRKKKK